MNMGKLKMYNKIKMISMMIFILLIASCVGTVQDKNAPSSKVASSEAKSTPISFEGLAKLNPIAENKIEVYFYEAETSADEVTYELYVNNSAVPIKLSSKSLPKISGGFLVFTLGGLETNTMYSFNMRAIPAGEVSNARLDATKTLYATTFNNETATFAGVSSATTLPGADGKTKVLVKWVPANDSGLGNGTDPNRYEISYISQDGGIANINTVGASTRGTKIVAANAAEYLSTGGVVVDGLSAGKKYYFQVRAIHNSYDAQHAINPNYHYEMNTRYAEATTTADGAALIFNTQVTLSNIVGLSGLTAMNVAWTPAVGVFNNYYLCYKQTNNTSVDQIVFSTSTTVSNGTISNGASCISIDASKNFYKLSGLNPYLDYQVKIVACATVSCGGSERSISGTLNTLDIKTPVAQFNGITEILNPNSFANVDDLKKLTMNFSPPVKSTGYLSKLKLMCHGSSTSTGVEIPLTGPTAGGTGVDSRCNGITLVTSTIPTEILSNIGSDNSFYSTSVKTLTVQLPNSIDNTTEFCFSLTPQITNQGVAAKSGQQLLKCITPKLFTPTITQFPGKNLGCQLDSAKKLRASWPKVTGGLLSHYLVFWREKVNGNDFFNFTDAKNAYSSASYADTAPATSTYQWMVVSEDGLANKSVATDNLKFGSTYSIGVIPLLKLDATTVFYGQDNFNVDDCAIPLPKAKFNEWTDIFAIGPKEDGLTPGHSTFIPETLDEDGIPVEVEVESDGKTPVSTDLNSTMVFDGVFGVFDGVETNNKYIYSNSGIVKIAWKEVSLVGISDDSIEGHYTETDEADIAKKAFRKYGYKVFRSVDNQKTWVELTADNNSETNPNLQVATNKGLIHSAAITNVRERNNETGSTVSMATFTDYSVKFSTSNGDVDRARIYYYKIVPIYNGKELQYEDSSNPNHHIVRVTLPPKNMALVHRLIANRTLCLELNHPSDPDKARVLNKSASGYYSCSFNGLGAKSLSVPWTTDTTVIDQGGDLLVDRFELSCPFTRGSKVVAGTYSSSKVASTVDALTFKGESSSGPYKGCLHNGTDGDNTYYDPGRGLGSLTGSSNHGYESILPGDCIGSDLPLSMSTSTSTCTDNARVGHYRFYYPGTNVTDTPLDCTTDGNQGGKYINLFDSDAQINKAASAQTQSEFGAVYYMRTGYNMTWSTFVPSKLVNGKTGLTYDSASRQSSCMVNLPYENASGEWRPRWLSINMLFGRLSDGATKLDDLYKQKLSTVISNSHFYSGSDVKPIDDSHINTSLEARGISRDTSLIRVATSNASKLPPLVGVSQSQYQQICSMYKIEVGVDNGSGTTSNFKATESKDKRLLRRSEFVTASAWPAIYNATKVNQIEKGTYYELKDKSDAGSDHILKGCNGVNRKDTSDAYIKGDGLYTAGQTIGNLITNFNRPDAVFIEGSSAKDSIIGSTEKCVSKYGIQDLVGNMAETTSDIISCDTSDYVRKFSHDLFTSVPNNTYFESLLAITNRISVPVTPSAGKCSVVNVVESATPASDYSNGSTMLDINTFLGSLSNFVKNPKGYDQNSVLTARNGDGVFLNFGQGKLLPSLTQDNAISPTVMSELQYFNPVLGLPMSCDGGSCNTSDDNKKYATSLNYDMSSTDYYNSNFPINNSKFNSFGLKDVTSGDSNDTRYLADGTSVDIFLESTSVPGNYNNSDIKTYYLSQWKVARAMDSKLGISVANLIMYSGGSFNFDSGRYSLFLNGQFDIDQQVPNVDYSGRCGIIINQN